MEEQIHLMDERFRRLNDAAMNRNKALEEVDGRLDALTEGKAAMETWADGVFDALDAKDNDAGAGGSVGGGGGVGKDKEKLEQWKKELDERKEELRKMEDEVGALKGNVTTGTRREI